MAGGGGYSGVAPILYLCYKLFSITGWAACFTLFQIFAIYEIFKLIQENTQENKLTNSFASTLMLSMMCFIEAGYWSVPYVGTIIGNPYHNVTYSAMLPFALASFRYFLKCWDVKISCNKINYFLYVLNLTIATIIKPSYVFVFSFTLLALLIFSVFKSRFRNIKDYVLLGAAVLPSAAVCLVQSMLLFSNDNKIIFAPFVLIIRYAGKIPVKIIISMLFVSGVLLLCRKKYKTFDYWFALGLWLTAFLEYSMLAESGSRMYHGNFGWGLLCAMMIFFTESLIVLLRDINYSKKLEFRHKMCIILFAYHVIAGISYCLHVLAGKGY